MNLVERGKLGMNSGESRRFRGLQERLKKVGEEEYPSEEGWKKRVGELLTEIEEKIERKALSRKDFNLALEKAKKLNILGLLRPEEFKRRKTLEKERRHYISVLIDSIPPGNEETSHYIFKFYADEKSKEGVPYFTLARQVFDLLCEAGKKVLEFEKKEREREDRQRKLIQHFDESESLFKTGKYNRDRYQKDLEFALKLGFIKEITSQELDKIVREKEKSPEVIKFFEWQKPVEGGPTERISRLFIFSGSTNFERTIFKDLKGWYLKAMLEIEKKRAEQGGATKERRPVGTRLEERPQVQQELEKLRRVTAGRAGKSGIEIKSREERPQSREEVFEKTKEKLDRKQTKAERKQMRKIVVEKLKELGLSEVDIQKIRDCADMKIKPEEINNLRKFLEDKKVLPEEIKRIFEVFKIESE